MVRTITRDFGIAEFCRQYIRANYISFLAFRHLDISAVHPNRILGRVRDKEPKEINGVMDV